MVQKLFTIFIVVAAILASPKHRTFTWSYRSVFIEFTGPGLAKSFTDAQQGIPDVRDCIKERTINIRHRILQSSFNSSVNYTRRLYYITVYFCMYIVYVSLRSTDIAQFPVNVVVHVVFSCETVHHV